MNYLLGVFTSCSFASHIMLQYSFCNICEMIWGLRKVPSQILDWQYDPNICSKLLCLKVVLRSSEKYELLQSSHTKEFELDEWKLVPCGLVLCIYDSWHHNWGCWPPAHVLIFPCIRGEVLCWRHLQNILNVTRHDRSMCSLWLVSNHTQDGRKIIFNSKQIVPSTNQKSTWSLPGWSKLYSETFSNCSSVNEW